MNPCPCGHLFDRKKKCRCSSEVVQRYLGKISGPLLDRIDIHLDVPALDARELRLAETGESSEVIRTRVEAARRIQEKRFAESRTGSNSRMRPREIRKFAALSNEGENLLEKSVENLGLSARAHDRILRVARTIADLAQSERIQPDHLAEAISYRVLDKIRM
jgi:magnesium chelatase family protein